MGGKGMGKEQIDLALKPQTLSNPVRSYSLATHSLATFFFCEGFHPTLFPVLSSLLLSVLTVHLLLFSWSSFASFRVFRGHPLLFLVLGEHP